MPVFGELEQAVMDVLWSSPTALSVRAVQAALAGERELAYTTVMTVMDRLAKKGQLLRELDGRAWHYRPAQSWAELVRDEIVALLDSGPADQRQAVLDEVRQRVG
ncbi:MAG: BlaI/MecI/CopY family transcriptional regulator [Micropruina sp.]|uniref:BlaI/MecI/CopY family transcriptional regulator n=1 Tax=Micropruina sp. TaxID=2737536 RepID=UPI0039E54A80